MIAINWLPNGYERPGLSILIKLYVGTYILSHALIVQQQQIGLRFCFRNVMCVCE